MNERDIAENIASELREGLSGFVGEPNSIVVKHQIRDAILCILSNIRVKYNLNFPNPFVKLTIDSNQIKIGFYDPMGSIIKDTRYFTKGYRL